MRRAIALAAAVALSGCQDYRFNPVGVCTLQPGQYRLPLLSISTADILFVVDDSGSMEPMQQNLSDNFLAFIDDLADTQAERASRGLEPLEFHIAVTTSAVFEARASAATCTGTPLTCNISSPTVPPAYSYACTTSGAPCADVVEKYFREAPACTTGVAGPVGTPYPAGDFVRVGTNPRVLHFVKTLNWASWGTATPDPALTQLVQQFRENILVGSCGSNEEQHLEAGRLAMEKALALGAAAEFPHANSKLVVVWVGNEDDCSQPQPVDQANAIILGGAPGADTCTTESAKPLAEQKLVPVGDIASFFGGLGRQVDAAFIYPGAQVGATFVPGSCICQAPYSCQAYGPGRRFQALANAFRLQGSTVVEASICDGSFASTLHEIGQLVKPPEGLQLYTFPASGEVTRLRIVDGAGKTVHVCVGPDYTAGEWWFTVCPGLESSPPTGGSPIGSEPNTCLAIRSGSACEASPGQTYVAEYLGRVPPDGCASVSDCQAALGGSASDWVCDIGTGLTRGTCLCAQQ